MKYYRVKPEFDNKPMQKIIAKSAHKTVIEYDSIYIGNELFTESELRKHCKNHIVNKAIFEEVNINKNNTYFSFGARFEVGNSYKNIA